MCECRLAQHLKTVLVGFIGFKNNFFFFIDTGWVFVIDIGVLAYWGIEYQVRPLVTFSLGW